MSFIYYGWMAKGREFEGGEGAYSPRIEMMRSVKQLMRWHQLAEVESLVGSTIAAKFCKEAAVHYGIRLITLTDLNQKYRKELDNALAWLSGRDHEMYGHVQGTLDQAEAAREMAKKNGGRT